MHLCPGCLRRLRKGPSSLTATRSSGNDLEGLYATTHGSLSPVWNWLNTYGLDTTGPEDPKIVFAAISRGSSGYRIVENRDTLGMRATQSHDTILEGVFVPDRYVQRTASRVSPEPTTFSSRCLAVSSRCSATSTLGSLSGLAIERVKKKTSVAMARSMTFHPGVQHIVAQVFYELEAMTAQVERIADDWTNNVDHASVAGKTGRCQTSLRGGCV